MDLSAMIYDPLEGLGSRLIWDVHDDFTKYRPLSSPPPSITVRKDSPTIPVSEEDWDQVIRFCIVFAIKKGNPLASERDFEFRAKKCMEIIGIEQDSVAYTIITSNHISYLLALVQVLKLNHDDDFALWLSLRVKYYSDVLYLMQPEWTDSDNARNNNIMKNIDDQRKRMSTLENRIFVDQETRKIVSDYSDPTNLWAEKYAKSWT